MKKEVIFNILTGAFEVAVFAAFLIAGIGAVVFAAALMGHL